MAHVSRLANVTISVAAEDGVFKIEKQGLWNILAAALVNTDFDADFYVETNKDVRDGIKSGEIVSAFDHFVKFGFLEGRRGWRVKVDERFYLAEYDDVRRSIENGQFKTGQEHFDTLGEAEGRQPYRGFTYFKTEEAIRRKPFMVFGKARKAYG